MVNLSFCVLWCSFDTILNQVAVQRKRLFVERVLSYWVMKRQSRNNVPLIRRLQANPQPSKAKQMVSADDYIGALFFNIYLLLSKTLCASCRTAWRPTRH